MKSYLWLVVIILVILAVLLLLMKSNSNLISKPSGATVVVLMKADTFEPQTLQIKKGTTVKFKNVDTQSHWPASDIHPTHGIYPEFDPQKPIEPGQSWSFTFDKVGAWKDHDHLVPFIRGEITVTE